MCKWVPPEQRTEFVAMNRGHSYAHQPYTRVLIGAYDKVNARIMGVSVWGDNLLLSLDHVAKLTTLHLYRIQLYIQHITIITSQTIIEAKI